MNEWMNERIKEKQIKNWIACVWFVYEWMDSRIVALYLTENARLMFKFKSKSHSFDVLCDKMLDNSIQLKVNTHKNVQRDGLTNQRTKSINSNKIKCVWHCMSFLHYHWEIEREGEKATGSKSVNTLNSPFTIRTIAKENTDRSIE